MKLQKIVIKGFRCFGPEGATIRFEDDTTMLVGPNGTGKTAVLAALARMFGSQGRGRGLVKTDFNSRQELPPDGVRRLSIEAWFSFAELESDDADHSAASDLLEDLTFESEHGICLRACLTGELQADDQIDEQLVALRTTADEPSSEDIARFGGMQRSAVQVIYVPAARDPSRELATSTSAIIGRLLRALKRGEKWSVEVTNASEAVSGVIGGHEAVARINEVLKETWGRLYRGQYLKEPRLQFSPAVIDDLLAQASILFSPDHGEPADVGQLSDGQRSLFFLTLIDVACTLERELRIQTDSDLFDIERIRPPAFTLIALEEPENHLASHFLGRVLRVIERFSTQSNAQALVATHAPGLAGRVRPEAIRHFRLDPDRTVSVSPLTLPPVDSEAYMLLKETLWAYPELLFSRVVVLCEGDSEQLVLPRLFAACATPPVQGSGKILIPFEIDDSFVSVTPLDGRHTNHYWKLLHDLKIPFVTLLDLDLGRAAAGMRRVSSAFDNIRSFHHKDEVRKAGAVRMTQIRALPKGPQDPRTPIPGESFNWLDDLEKLNVFFSGPLDLDLMMLESFPKEYQKLEDGEKGPKAVTEKGKTALFLAVLGSQAGKKDKKDDVKDDEDVDDSEDEDGDDNEDEDIKDNESILDRIAPYTDKQKALFLWYRYRFLSKHKGKGKPAAHLRALSQISPQRLRSECPEVLKRLVVRVQELAAALTE